MTKRTPSSRASWAPIPRASLTSYALARLRSIPGITIYGPSELEARGDRVGVIPFNVGSLPHGLVAAILACEAGVGVRSGCFCAQSYVARLLALTPQDQGRWRRAHLNGDRSRRPGMVRVSLGAYNTGADIDALVEMLERIARDDYDGQYYQAPETGDYRVAGDEDAVRRCFSMTVRPGDPAMPAGANGPRRMRLSGDARI